MTNKTHKILGMMTGTSMDGIDISLVESNGENVKSIKNFYFEYSTQIRKELSIIQDKVKTFTPNFIKENYDYLISQLHIEAIMKFKNFDEYDYIGFHGQTILHDPKNKLSLQLGDPNLISKKIQKNIIFDFRSNDLKNGGQGAPLAPIYHQNLMERYNLNLPCCFINIGGITNITYWDNETLLGYDIGPGNVMMDDFANIFFDLRFDKNGSIASSGKVIRSIIENFFDYFNYFLNKPPPKSLDTDQFKSYLKKLNIDKYKSEDILATLTEITALVISLSVKNTLNKIRSILITGGGANNQYLMSRIKKLVDCKIIDASYLGLNLNFIESELIAYLSARFLNKLPSTFQSTTGTNEPTICGKIIYYKKPF